MTSSVARVADLLAEAAADGACCTDDPVQVCTTIGREYAIAHLLGFSAAELLDITRTAIQASFTPEERRAALLTGLRGGNDPA